MNFTDKQKDFIYELNQIARKIGYDKIKIFSIERGKTISGLRNYHFISYYKDNDIIYPIEKNSKPPKFIKQLKVTNTRFFLFKDLKVFIPLSEYMNGETVIREYGVDFIELNKVSNLNLNLSGYVKPKKHNLGKNDVYYKKYKALDMFLHGGKDSKGKEIKPYSDSKFNEKEVLAYLKNLDPFDVFTIQEANKEYAEELLNDMLVVSDRKYIAKIIGKKEKDITNLFKKFYQKEFNTVDFPSDMSEQYSLQGTQALKELILSKTTKENFSMDYLRDVDKGDRGIKVLSYNIPETIINIEGTDISITVWND